MSDYFATMIANAIGASSAEEREVIQPLWSGYGKISRYMSNAVDFPSVIVKHIQFPERSKRHTHPRGWNTEHAHQRKVTSYHIESYWYKYWNDQCDIQCRVPRCCHIQDHEQGILLVLEDLDASGFPLRKSSLNVDEMFVCLKWLANFHACFMTQKPKGLWEQGTYWHLDTRPDELAALEDTALKKSATYIDQKLKQSPFQTFVHGDAKLANFCFSEDGKSVAAVDFQYVGGGCGMKDVALFISSCLNSDECDKNESTLLDCYFDALTIAIKKRHPSIDVCALEENWRSLYAFAWADFYRFLKGWSPDHWKIHHYSTRLSNESIGSLKHEFNF